MPTFRSTRQVTIESRRVGWTDRSGGPLLHPGLVTLWEGTAAKLTDGGGGGSYGWGGGSEGGEGGEGGGGMRYA